MSATAPSGPAHLPGPDTLRALAIVLVFMHHYGLFVSHAPTFGAAGTLGWVGVDLFFVLSGYLIAEPLLAGLMQGRRLNLPAFYARRALRTWPVFAVVLAAFFLWPAVMGGRTPPPLWRFLTFTQNLGLQPGTAFSHAWSLCVEEQFYAVLPLVLMAGARLGWGRRAGWALLAGLTLLGMGARCLLWTRHGLEADGQVSGYHPAIYYATLCRFDEFLPGIAVALLRHTQPARWALLMRHGQRVLLAGIAACALMGWLVLNRYYVDGVGYPLFMTGFGYSLNAMAFAVLLVAALSPQSWLGRWRLPGAATLAAWSYAIYLSHKPVAHALQQALGPDWHGGPLLLAVTAACLLTGALLHALVERPGMALRARWVPAALR